MIAIITGDIMNSRDDEQQNWLISLKEILNTMGNTPQHWEIFRGDSFQLETTAIDALKNSILIKAAIKQDKLTDVRMGIGLGEKTNSSDNITEANGSAFIHSGNCFDQLKKITLAVKSDDPAFDADINLLLELALLTMDNWTGATARIMRYALQYEDLNQEALAKKLNLKSQSSVSEALSRGGYDEITKLIMAYNNKLSLLKK